MLVVKNDQKIRQFGSFNGLNREFFYRWRSVAWFGPFVLLCGQGVWITCPIIITIVVLSVLAESLSHF